MSNLFDEMRRRNVFRMAVAYIVSAWLILQVADVVLNNIDAPDWVFSVFLLALALGFLPVIFFSWAYEITPEGVKRESEVDRSQSITRHTGRKLDQVTIALLVTVVAFVIAERMLFPTDPAPVAAPATVETPPEPVEEVTGTAVDEKSIAVLAFDDLSAEGDQAFFAEGLSEELLNVLAQMPGLKVAGRTSSFAFKGKDTDLREIGEILNVANILEGSVRKAGNRIRVTAQLIKASDGFHLFSQSYDRDLDDIFRLQDELAALIADALKAQLTGGGNVPAVTPTNLETFDDYLLARQHIRRRNPELMEEAIGLLDQALARDPDYVPAIVQKALATALLSDGPGSYGTIPETEAIAEALALLDRARSLDPDNAEAHAVTGLVLTDQAGVNVEATASLRRALELNPNLESAKLWLASITDDADESFELLEDVVFRDPLYGPAFNNLIQGYLARGEQDKADALVDRVRRVAGLDENVEQAVGSIAFLRGNLAEAARGFQTAYDVNPNATVVAAIRSYVLLALGDLERAAEEGVDPVKLIAFRELGDFEAADELLESMDFRGGDRLRKIRHAADYLAATGRAAEMARIVERDYGNAAAIVAGFPLGLSFGTEYMGPLAYAYLQAGMDDEYRLIVAAMKDTLDKLASTGIDNTYFWYCRAQYAALTGDATGAAAHLQHALDDGWVAPFFVEPLFGLVADDPGVGAVAEAALARANEERAKLGMEPYAPVAASF